MKAIGHSVMLALTLLAINTLAAGEEPAVAHFDLVIKNRQIQLEENTLRVTQGVTVELVWSSDEDVDLHLHGYDIEFHVKAGTPASESFPANATGRFPVTSHGFSGEDNHGHEALMYLEVYPE